MKVKSSLKTKKGEQIVKRGKKMYRISSDPRRKARN